MSRRPIDVELEDWKYLVEYFGSPEFKVVSERNRKNREKQITKHACGTRSFAEVEESTEKRNHWIEFGRSNIHVKMIEEK